MSYKVLSGVDNKFRVVEAETRRLVAKEVYLDSRPAEEVAAALNALCQGLGACIESQVHSSKDRAPGL